MIFQKSFQYADLLNKRILFSSLSQIF